MHLMICHRCVLVFTEFLDFLKQIIILIWDFLLLLISCLINVCVKFCVSYFCLVDVRLKQDTLRLLPLETILEWELASVKDGQLVGNNHVGIVIVLFM